MTRIDSRKRSREVDPLHTCLNKANFLSFMLSSNKCRTTEKKMLIFRERQEEGGAASGYSRRGIIRDERALGVGLTRHPSTHARAGGLDTETFIV